MLVLISLHKIFIAGIILASYLGVLALPVNTDNHSSRLSTTSSVSLTSESHNPDDVGVLGLERRDKKPKPLSMGFIIIPKSDIRFTELSLKHSSLEVLYVVVLGGQSYFIKEGNEIFHRTFPRSGMHQVTSLDISLPTQISDDPEDINNAIPMLETVTRKESGCAWIIKMVHFLTQCMQAAGGEVGISEKEEDDARDKVIAKENRLGIAPSCGKGWYYLGWTTGLQFDTQKITVLVLPTKRECKLVRPVETPKANEKPGVSLRGGVSVAYYSSATRIFQVLMPYGPDFIAHLLELLSGWCFIQKLVPPESRGPDPPAQRRTSQNPVFLDILTAPPYERH
ncbi:hypothetical protein EV368DRAFT_81498 [Lentinula lateritia]|nr:hypothetical protein EV368DRAFT_81498 [Lentinula lateritia]